MKDSLETHSCGSKVRVAWSDISWVVAVLWLHVSGEVFRLVSPGDLGYVLLLCGLPWFLLIFLAQFSTFC